MLDSRKSINLETQNGRHNLPFVPYSAETRCILRPGVYLKTRTCLFGQTSGVVVARRQFQVYARDFHFLVCVLDPHVREGDLAIHNGQAQLIRESKLGVLIPAFTWGLGLTELSI